MKLLVLQHAVSEHPGSLRQELRSDGIAWDTIQLDEGGRIPPLEDYDMLWVMGGPMDVWDVDEYPWLIEEKRAIRRFADRPLEAADLQRILDAGRRSRVQAGDGARDDRVGGLPPRVAARQV